MGFPHPKRKEIVDFLLALREDIIRNFEELESSSRFEKKPWSYHQQGGGEMAVIRGDVFEKAAVNWSGVEGHSFPMKDAEGPFYATGVSLITHMHNPHAPTVHFNIRFIETEKQFWFAGGYDLTPMGFPYQEDTDHFHQTSKDGLDPHGPHLYPDFSAKAKEYFFITHRKKERGVGGIFFDHYNSGNFEKDFDLWKSVGRSFLPAIMPIYKNRVHTTWTPEDKEIQLYLRAHYVEFNLMYDRGTKFGFQSGGNPEAILCSMPPSAKW